MVPLVFVFPCLCIFSSLFFHWFLFVFFFAYLAICLVHSHTASLSKRPLPNKNSLFLFVDLSWSHPQLTTEYIPHLWQCALSFSAANLSVFFKHFFPLFSFSLFNAPCQPIWPQSSVAVILNSQHYLFIHCHVLCCLCFFYLFNFFFIHCSQITFKSVVSNHPFLNCLFFFYVYRSF